MYQPDQVYRSRSVKTWPGDWEGRAILGLTLLERSTGREARYLKQILAKLPAQTNEYGYFGARLDRKSINEQLLSGNGWMLRALCERYQQTRDPRMLEILQKTVRHLVLPTRGLHASYPIDPAARKATGEAAGGTVGQIGKWQVSSDVGCDFIFLAGVAHAAALLEDRGAGEVVEEMIERFLMVDLERIKAQTHASLTAMTALLRWYDRTGDSRLLTAVRDRYRLYRTKALTETFSNYNWFGRPEWSEPCAIIDSLIVANQLWRYTGETAYLEDAHQIWFNGLGRAQRANGGYGTDTCVSARNPSVKVHLYEAFWCCTMRGGEGHARSIEYSYFTRPGELAVTFFNDSVATLNLGTGTVRLRQTTGYPYEGSVKLEVLGSTVRTPAKIRLFAPHWTARHQVRRNGQAVTASATGGWVEVALPLRAGDAVEYSFEQKVGPREAVQPSDRYQVMAAGPLVLGAAAAPVDAVAPRTPLAALAAGVFQAHDSFTLSRLNDLNELRDAEKDPCLRQVLFRRS